MRGKQSITLLIFLLSFGNALKAQYKVEGRVIDFDTRLPVKDVSVTIKETKSGVTTNDSGYFSINVYLEELTIQFSYIGYTGYSRSLYLPSDNRFLQIVLKKKANELLDEIVINAFKDYQKVKTTEMNIIRLNPESIKRAPLIFGEADIVRALILQPGVNNGGEASGGFNVRGGNTDQNLVLLDGAPLFNTSHLLGFYSSVSPDAVQDATLYKGGMPAEYGGRLSSLLNMRIKSGLSNRMSYSGGISPVSARFLASGPLIKEKLAVTGGFRVAYPNLILNQFKGKYGSSRAFFYDGLLKAEWQINPANRLSVLGYRSFDEFRFDNETSYEWQSDLLTMNYSSAISGNVSLKVNANLSNYRSVINGLVKNYESRLESDILHKQVKAVVEINTGERNKISFGADFIHTAVSPGKREPATTGSNINFQEIEHEQGMEYAAFISDEINFTERISMQAGIRFALYHYRGPKKVYRYEEALPFSKESIQDSVLFGKNDLIQKYGGPEPRLALKIGVSEELTLKLSYNRGQQFLHLISNSTAISPVDFWKLSDNYIRRQIGDQYAAGIFKSIRNNLYEFSAELYFRTAKNVVQYKDGGSLLLNPYIETALLNGRSRAYGMEISVAKNSGNITGQLNYTLSRTQVQVLTPFPSEIINDGNYYPADTDRPHNLALMGRIKLGRGWSFNTNFVFISGRPATYPDGNYSYNNSIVTNYSKRNMDRLPAYHRLDMGFAYISKRYPEQRKYSVWNISFYNVYMRENPYSVYFNRADYRLKAYQLSVIGTIIPSVTWNFYF